MSSLQLNGAVWLTDVNLALAVAESTDSMGSIYYRMDDFFFLTLRYFFMCQGDF